MFWRYTLFEAKLICHNWKNAFVGAFILLFFVLSLFYQSHTEYETLKQVKKQEADALNATLNQFPDELRETKEGKRAYDNLTEQASLVGMQIYYLTQDDARQDYIEDDHKLTKLRLDAIKQGNVGVPDNLAFSKEYVSQEDTRIRYIEKHQLPLEVSNLSVSGYLPNALDVISGPLFCLLVLVAASEMIVFERKHQSVVNGIPVSFITKIHSKILVHFISIFGFLLIGLLLGMITSWTRYEWGDFLSPMMVYTNGDFEAVSTTRYLLAELLGFALTAILLLYLSVLLNLLVKNSYMTVFVGMVFILLPDFWIWAGRTVHWIYPVKFTAVSDVLSGEMAMIYKRTHMDYTHGFIWLVLGSVLLLIWLIVQNRWHYFRRRPQS